MDRRQFVIATGAAAAVGLAGCLGDDDTDSPEGVVEAYFDAAEDADEDAAEDLLHPESEIEPEVEEDGIEFDSIDADAEVVMEDIDSAELEDFDPDMEGDPEIQPQNLSNDDLDAVAADEEVALVAADLEVEIAELEEGDPDEAEEFFEEAPVHVITATDGDEWYVLDEVHYDFGGF